MWEIITWEKEKKTMNLGTWQNNPILWVKDGTDWEFDRRQRSQEPTRPSNPLTQSWQTPTLPPTLSLRPTASGLEPARFSSGPTPWHA